MGSLPTRASTFQRSEGGRAPWFAACLLCAAPAASAQIRKLNDALSRDYLGDVFTWQVSASGRVVFASSPFGSHLGLFSVPLDGSAAPVDLARPGTFFGPVRGLTVAADGARVVCEVGTLNEADLLYSAFTDGSGVAAKLSPSEDFFVASYRLAPDSSRVVYLGALGFRNELFSAPMDGSASAVRLNADLVANTAVSSYKLSADSRWVVYVANQASGGPGAYRVPLDGSGPPVALSPSLASGRGVSAVHVSADSTRVVYLADQDTDDEFALYGVPLDGSASAVRISGATVSGGDVQGDFVLSPDSTRVAYVADALTDEDFELFSAPLDGSASPVRLNGALPVGGDVAASPFEDGCRISADSSRVVYLADQLTHGVFELFSVPLDGSAAAMRISGSLVPGGSIQEFELTPDATRALYLADARFPGVTELFSTPLDGHAPPVRLSDDLAPGGDVRSFTIDPTSRRVTYVADARVDEKLELFVTRTDGSSSAVHLGPETVAGNAAGSAFDALGEHVVFSVETTVPGKSELFSDAFASGAALNLSGAPAFVAVVGDVTDYKLAADRRHLVYHASLQRDLGSGDALYGMDLDAPGLSASFNLSAPLEAPVLRGVTPDGSRVVFNATAPPGLYSARLDGSSGPLQLSALPLTGSFPSAVQLSPDGSTAAFLGEESAFKREVFAVPVDASQSARKLNAPFAAQSDASALLMDPTGRLLVYQADQRTDEVLELFAVPLDGSAAPTLLNGALVAGGQTRNAAFSPDGARVVYLADQFVLRRVELFSAAVPPAAPNPVRLSAPPLPTSGDVLSFAITGDSRRVVYLTYQGSRQELFSRPIDGSGTAKRLNADLVSGGSVSDYALSADGARVVYLADQTTDETFELYAVPSDGSAPPVRLNAPLASGRDVRPGFAFSRDGTQVVFLADAAANDRDQVYVVPSDGSASPRSLSGPMPSSGHAVSLSLSGDDVLYIANQQRLVAYDLFRVPLDGHESPRRVCADLLHGGNVVDYAALAGGERVVYRADQEADERFELYLRVMARRTK